MPRLVRRRIGGMHAKFVTAWVCRVRVALVSPWTWSAWLLDSAVSQKRAAIMREKNKDWSMSSHEGTVTNLKAWKKG